MHPQDDGDEEHRENREGGNHRIRRFAQRAEPGGAGEMCDHHQDEHPHHQAQAGGVCSQIREVCLPGIEQQPHHAESKTADDGAVALGFAAFPQGVLAAAESCECSQAARTESVRCSGLLAPLR